MYVNLHPPWLIKGCLFMRFVKVRDCYSECLEFIKTINCYSKYIWDWLRLETVLLGVSGKT